MSTAIHTHSESHGRPKIPGLVWARFKLCLATIVFCVVLIFFGWGFLSEGVRINFPSSAIPIARWKAVSTSVQHFDFAHRLDSAAPAAIVVVFLAWWAYDFLLQLWTLDPEAIPIRRRQRREKYQKAAATFAIVLIVFDVWTFYAAVTSMAWGGVFSAKALVAALGYGAVLGIVSLLMLNLRQDIEDLKQEYNR